MKPFSCRPQFSLQYRSRSLRSSCASPAVISQARAVIASSSWVSLLKETSGTAANGCAEKYRMLKADDSIGALPTLQKYNGRYWMIYHSYPSAAMRRAPRKSAWPGARTKI